MTSAFGGQRSIQLSYGCMAGRLAEGTSRCQRHFAPGRTVRAGRACAISTLASPMRLVWFIMDATPFDFGDARPLSGGGKLMRIESPPGDMPARLAGHWSAIHEAAATVAAISGIERRSILMELARGSAGPSVVDRSDEQQVGDLAEVLQRGIAALLIAHTSGGMPQAAARALWKEFLTTRETLMADGPGARVRRQVPQR